MAALTKHLLSESLSGRAINVTSTASISATTFHVAGDGMANYDECWIYAYNHHSDDIQTTILWGMSSLSADDIRNEDKTSMNIPFQSGRVLVMDGRLIQNGLSACVYSEVAGVVNIDGFINRVTG